MKQQNRITEGPILGALVRFSGPIILALFLQAMYGAVDLLVVGQFGNTADVSGVATGSMLLQTLTMIITGLSMGITVLVGEAIGKRDNNQASKAIGTGICIFIVIALIMTLALSLNSGAVTNLLQAPDNAFEQTKSYIFICGLGSIFIIAYNVMGAIFRGVGDSKTPLMTVAIACVINIGCDLLFVSVFHWGAAGAALATVLSQGISVIISLIIIRKKELPFTFSKKTLYFDTYYVKKIFAIGLPVAVQEMLVGFSFLFIQIVVNSFGINESAGVGVAEKIAQFLMLLGSAALQSISVFVAQNIGAGKLKRAKQALWQGITISFGIGAVMGLLAFFAGDIISGIFANDILVIKQSHLYLKAYAIDCFIMPVLFCFLGYFNGREKTMFVLVQGIVGAFLVRVPLVILFSKMDWVTLFYIGIGTPAASVVQVAMCVIYFVYLNRKNQLFNSN